MDGRNISTAKLGYVINPNYAIYCHSSRGPHMGNDICCGGSNWGYGKNYYPDIGSIPATLKIEDYEVFQIIKVKNFICSLIFLASAVI